MPEKIPVGIVDDHQAIIDGYLYRLAQTPTILVEFTLGYGYEILQMLDEHRIEVLLLDISVPTSPDNPNPYPIPHIIPELLRRYPTLRIIVVTMFCEKSLIKAVMSVGSSGYILKDDQAAIRQLGEIIKLVANGEKYLSNRASLLLNKKDTKSGKTIENNSNLGYWLSRSMPSFYQSLKHSILWFTLIVLVLIFCILIVALPR